MTRPLDKEDAVRKAQPVFTQRMTMHLNGGSKFSQLDYEIMADGKTTGITRHTRTNGRPKYLKTKDVFVDAKGNEFDVMATKGEGLMEWLTQVSELMEKV